MSTILKHEDLEEITGRKGKAMIRWLEDAGIPYLKSNKSNGTRVVSTTGVLDLILKKKHEKEYGSSSPDTEDEAFAEVN